jgi:hypothetical protein
MGVLSYKNYSSCGETNDFNTFIGSKLYLSVTGFESGFSGFRGLQRTSLI